MIDVYQAIIFRKRYFHTSSVFRHKKLLPAPEVIYDSTYPLMIRARDNLGTITFSSVMGTDEVVTSNKTYPIGPDGKRLKPCCACPDTKRARDACVIEKGEENCIELIEAHKACMRNLGFNI